MRHLIANRIIPFITGSLIALSCGGCASLTDALKDLNSSPSGPRTTPAPQVYRGVGDTALKDLFLGHENKEWPRVALTVITLPAPPWPQFGDLTVTYPATGGCYEISARIWRSARQSEDVKPFYFCPQDVQVNVPFRDITFLNLAPAGQKTTGSWRTLGPTPSASIYPDDVDTERLVGGLGPEQLRSELALVGSLMVAMHYDWKTETDLRVWIAEYVQAHSRYYRER